MTELTLTRKNDSIVEVKWFMEAHMNLRLLRLKRDCTPIVHLCVVYRFVRYAPYRADA
jgi:hypothetical protein